MRRPETTAAILVCPTCADWRKHEYAETREAGTAPMVKHCHWYRCAECSGLRVWGYETEGWTQDAIRQALAEAQRDGIRVTNRDALRRRLAGAGYVLA